MSFKVNALFRSDGYKVGHKRMLAPGTAFLYGTWIPRSLKHAPKGVTSIASFGHQMTWKWIHDEFQENFFNLSKEEAVFDIARDLTDYLGMDYDAKHFEELYDLGYLPIKVKALPEGINTPANVPHMTFINTVNGFAWLTLYLETIVSSLAWKPATSATIALQYRKNTTEWVMKTDPERAFLIDWMCHDFSARGLDPWSMISSGLGHATSHMGSDTLTVIPAARYFYNETAVAIGSVNASEHSVSTTKIFTVGEKQMLIDWLKEFPTGILSVVADTFDLWKLVTEYLADPEVKELIMARDGKLVIRPDSGDPVDIICGEKYDFTERQISKLDEFIQYKKDGTYTHGIHTIVTENGKTTLHPLHKGVIELLWDIFGGTVNEQGYKVLDSHIGAIYGDSINLERQVQIYERLAKKDFASTNIVLGVGSFTYQMNTRDTFGFAAKGAWFAVEEGCKDFKKGEYSGACDPVLIGYNIYKDPITDDGTKKSLKGRIQVFNNRPDANGDDLIFDGKDQLEVNQECTEEQENGGLLQTIYEDGKFYNETTLTEIRNKFKNQ